MPRASIPQPCSAAKPDRQRNVARIDRRQLLKSGGVFSVASCFVAAGGERVWGANEEIRLGFIGSGGRANELMGQFEKVAGTRVVSVCDPDATALERAKKRYPQAKLHRDLRGLLDDDDVDAVVVATCNHWHCLASIWAMQAGKDVYVEKPLSHSQWEGEQTVAAARKYGRICQIGTQQRSDPMQAEIKRFLHEEKGLGAIQATRVNRYGVRAPIGKRSSPLPIDPAVDYNLWLGPAQDKPIFRDKLHYDWHWDFNTGSGEMGNWGVHVLDDVRNIVFRDSVALPQRILGAGGRVVYNDAGETPNVHFVYFDTGSIPVVIGLANIADGPTETGKKKGSSSQAAAHPGPGSGYIVYCEGGRYEGQRGKGEAFDADGKSIRVFKGNSGQVVHQQNFIDAVRSRDAAQLQAEVQVGHDSSGWCNLANIAFRAGHRFSLREAQSVSQPHWRELLESMTALLGRHRIALETDALRLSPMLTIDPKTQRFVGEHAAQANAFIRREYRRGFEVPEQV
jgi:hypothetical protein